VVVMIRVLPGKLKPPPPPPPILLMGELLRAGCSF
jgi:hypothetical protein